MTLSSNNIVRFNISADIQKLSHTDTVKISLINISNDSLNIKYGGTPSTSKYSGLLSTTAFNAAHGIDKDTFKSVGHLLDYYYLIIYLIHFLI